MQTITSLLHNETLGSCHSAKWNQATLNDAWGGCTASLGSCQMPWEHWQNWRSSEILPFQGLCIHARNVHASFLFLTRLIPSLLQKSIWYFLVTVESSWWSAFILGWCFSSYLTRQVFGKWPPDSSLFAVGGSCRHTRNLLSSYPKHFFVI